MAAFLSFMILYLLFIDQYIYTIYGPIIQVVALDLEDLDSLPIYG